MCGIVGIIGKQPVAARILDGLKRLEYRGYDSAGIATIHDGVLDRRRAQGKLSELSAILSEQALEGNLGIGHTRWATHGKAVTKNAHPHITDKVAVVHNGIIENFQTLKEELLSYGAIFESDTDSEVIAHLFTHYFDETQNIQTAAQKTFAALTGAYAIALIIAGHDDKIIVARRGSPLAIGYGEGETYLGSDSFALAPFTRRICYLEDDDWAILTPEGADIFLADGAKVTRSITLVDSTAAMVDKGNYRHFMAKEIHEQDDVLSRSFKQYIDSATARIVMPVNMPDLSAVNRIVFVACGTAFFAAQIARQWSESFGDIPGNCEIASEFRYRDAPMEKDCLTVFISQSGETADTLAALRHCKAHGLATLGVVNVPDSSLAREADFVLPTYAGPEIGVASTKAFTAQLAALAAFAISLGCAKQKIDKKQEADLVEQLLSVPRLVGDIIHNEPHIQMIAESFAEIKSALFIGRGAQFPIALEGALKLKEISYIHAEGFAAGELKHGSIALIDEHVPVIVLAPSDGLFEKTISNMHEIIARKGQVILLSDKKGLAAIGGDGLVSTIELPETNKLTAPILYVIPLQLLAYHAACTKGTDVDQPRNLAKSVTVE